MQMGKLISKRILCAFSLSLQSGQVTISCFGQPHLLLVQGKGFAFVQFTIPENAKNAVKELDKHAFRGRLLHIIPARKARDASGADFSSTNARCVCWW